MGLTRLVSRRRSIQRSGPHQDSVLIRRAKNDSEGAGRTTRLSSRSSEFVDQWLAAIGATRGPLLRPVYRSRALKKLSKRAELQTKGVSKVSGHSLRVGAAQQLVLDCRGILQVMRAGDGDR